MAKEKLPSESLENRIAQLSIQLDQRTEELSVINGVQEALAMKTLTFMNVSAEPLKRTYLKSKKSIYLQPRHI